MLLDSSSSSLDYPTPSAPISSPSHPFSFSVPNYNSLTPKPTSTDSSPLRNLIDFLPFEILSIIERTALTSPWHPGYRQLHLGSQLVGVLRRWRAVFGEDERFWWEVSLGGGRSDAHLLGKLEVFRSRSPLRVLRMGWGCRSQTGIIMASLKGKLSFLQRLEVYVDENWTLKDLWDAFLPSVPNLRTLAIVNLDRSLLRIPALPKNHILPSLVNLTLSDFRPTANASLSPLLRHVGRQLWCLELSNCCLSFAPIRRIPTGVPFVIQLLDLVALSFTGESILLDEPSSSIFLLPDLETLTLTLSSAYYPTLLFPPDPHPSNTSNLTSFRIHGECHYNNELSLIQDLQRMPLLETLELRSDDYSTDATLEALTVQEGDASPCAPLLRDLVIGSNERFTGGALVRMVKSREKLGRMGGGRGEVEIDHCGGVDEESVRWLEENMRRVDHD